MEVRTLGTAAEHLAGDVGPGGGGDGNEDSGRWRRGRSMARDWDGIGWTGDRERKETVPLTDGPGGGIGWTPRGVQTRPC